MTTFAPNYTNRYLVRYRAAGKVHTAMFRYGITPGPPDVALVTGVGNVLVALMPKLANDWAVLAASYIAAGTTISLPATAPVAGPGSIAWNAGDNPLNYSFVGRGVTGQPASFHIYGAQLEPSTASLTAAQDYRVLASEDADIASALTELNGIAGLTTTDGAAVVWHQYANVGYNAYYQRKSRNG